jgi:hypothetical protein
VAGQDESVDLARPAPLSPHICHWAMGVFGQWRGVPISGPQFVSGRWDNNEMKSVAKFISMVLVWVFFTANPAYSAPDFTSTELTTVQSIDFKLETNNGVVQLVTNMQVRWKTNEVTIISGSLGVKNLISSPLTEPCDSIFFGSTPQSGGNSRSILPNEIVEKSLVNGYHTYKLRFVTDLIDKQSQNGYKFCRGDYSIGNMCIQDETGNRWKCLQDLGFNSSMTLYGKVNWAQRSDLWDAMPSLYPCPAAYPDGGSGYIGLRTLCDSVNLSGIKFTLTDTLMQKAVADKAAADKAVADKAAADKAVADKAAADNAAAALKLQKEDFDAVQIDYQKMMKRISDLKIKYPNNSSLTGIEEKMRNLPIVLGKDLNTAKYNIASVNKSLDISEKVWAATQKTTVTCVKGKTVKKVTGINPKCPSGFKQK